MPSMDRPTTDGSWWQQLGPQGRASRLAAQRPFTRGELRGFRAVVTAFPVIVVVVATTIGVSAGRLAEATLLFVLLVGVQLLLLSPERRRQAVGRPSAADLRGRLH